MIVTCVINVTESIDISWASSLCQALFIKDTAVSKTKQNKTKYYTLCPDRTHTQIISLIWAEISEFGHPVSLPPSLGRRSPLHSISSSVTTYTSWPKGRYVSFPDGAGFRPPSRSVSLAPCGPCSSFSPHISYSSHVVLTTSALPPSLYLAKLPLSVSLPSSVSFLLRIENRGCEKLSFFFFFFFNFIWSC